MSENWLQRLADELTAGLAEYRKLGAEIDETQSRLGAWVLNSFELRALGSI